MATFSASSFFMPRTWMGPRVTFSRIDMCAKRLKLWKTMPSSARICVSSRPSCGRGLPSMRISPESMVSRRLMVRHMVDLPEPDGPMTTSTSPRSTSRLMSFRT